MEEEGEEPEERDTQAKGMRVGVFCWRSQRRLRRQEVKEKEKWVGVKRGRGVNGNGKKIEEKRSTKKSGF